MEVNKRLELTGLLQGVGFRPFIYQLCHRYQLKGNVLNNSAGVTIEIEGEVLQIDRLMKALYEELPPLARIDTLKSINGVIEGHKTFEIIQSTNESTKSALVSPDIALCEKCLDEMNDSTNRRYQYPFINCTDCGPRYSIVHTLPYDRPKTSMCFFKMCSACQKEYDNPLNRRFHAQPISCFDCGPQLSLKDAQGKVLSRNADALQRTVEAIKEGKIIAVKGLGGFHLLCDANNTQAIEALRNRKKRPSKPFAVMCLDGKSAETLVDMTAEEKSCLLSKEKPIVLMPKKDGSSLSDAVAPGIDRLGLFLAYTPVHYLLLQSLDRPLVATSANLSDEPIIHKAEEITLKLSHVVDAILDHDREILNANDDSVMQIVGKKTQFLRMARGFAPLNIQLPFKSKKKILALGGNQKNTLSLIIEDKLILSSYIGDLGSIEAFEYFERTLQSFERMYDFKAEVLVCDKHPEYETRKWAQTYLKKHPKIELLEVQHHYAHLLAVMAENKLDKEVLGFSFDGTGYGEDGRLWGAEVMLAGNHGYKRLHHLPFFRLLGGEKAIKEPRRSALSMLFEYYTLEEVLSMDVDVIQSFSMEEIILLHKAWERGLNSPYSSSAGRLFDAVASLCSLKHFVSYEGESGLAMEPYMDESIKESFLFSLKDDGEVDLKEMMDELIKVKETDIAISMFFNTLLEIIFSVSKNHPEHVLVFSGGVFQNRTLMNKVLNRAKEEGRKCLFQNTTAINDGGLSLGQAWYALQNI